MKTNKQIAEECAHAAWSWLCLKYGIPIPSVQQLFRYSSEPPIVMPSYQVSMTKQKPHYVPPVPGSAPGEIIASARNLEWLPQCKTNSHIESWTLQFVEGFTRAIEHQQRGPGMSNNKETVPPKATLNKIEFAKEFFPHLYRKNREKVQKILNRARAGVKREQQMIEEREGMR
jgi:hypothetical protein